MLLVGLPAVFTIFADKTDVTVSCLRGSCAAIYNCLLAFLSDIHTCIARVPTKPSTSKIETDSEPESPIKLAAPIGNASPPVLWSSRRKTGVIHRRNDIYYSNLETHTARINFRK
ncbi:hypothetical protein Trydic_g23847 [Trypoxylus dichotomus]